MTAGGSGGPLGPEPGQNDVRCSGTMNAVFGHRERTDLSIYALEDYCEIKHVMVSLG